ncbi:hypothetical protein [Streptomyces sp. NPDC048481]|uniref:hypothetical protein n=1 Tax=Streptomyces sp. NPDC048481 TaxID=3365557 RepID=UPI003710419D
MTGARRRWTDGSLTAGSLLRPHRVARAVFHPAWIPPSLDPTVEKLKRIRVVAGAVAAFGVYTFVEGGFAFDEMLENTAIASAVLFFLTPTTVGAMLFVWRRTGTVRQLKVPLVDALKLLLLFVGCVFATVGIFQASEAVGFVPRLLLSLAGLWMAVFVAAGAVRLSGNFFGTAAVHRCLPPLLATVTTWLMAVPDLVTGDLHGLSLTMGVVFILGAPLTVTGIALVETRRLRRRYGIRLAAHPATLPPTPAPPPTGPPARLPTPSGTHPYGAPYAPGARGPYPQGAPYTQGGNPYGHGGGNPYAPWPPHPGGRPLGG